MSDELYISRPVRVRRLSEVFWQPDLPLNEDGLVLNERFPELFMSLSELKEKLLPLLQEVENEAYFVGREQERDGIMPPEGDRTPYGYLGSFVDAFVAVLSGEGKEN